MRSLAIAAFFFAAAAAAQTPAESAWNVVNQAAAEAAAQDCTTACRALESLARATQRLCDIGPEHCEDARTKLREATERVRAACPSCKLPRAETAPRPPPGEMAPRPPAESGASTDSVRATESEKRGGCAGCSVAGSSTHAALFALVFGLVARAARRRRR